MLSAAGPRPTRDRDWGVCLIIRAMLRSTEALSMAVDTMLQLMPSARVLAVAGDAERRHQYTGREDN